MCPNIAYRKSIEIWPDNFRDSESGQVRVYPGKLQVSESFCMVSVTEATTVADLIEEALQKFGLQNFKSEDYRCSEILLDRGGKSQIQSEILTRYMKNCIQSRID